MARHQSLKDWFTQYRQTRDLETELDENIEQASTELISQDEKISALQRQINQSKFNSRPRFRPTLSPIPENSLFLSSARLSFLTLHFLFPANGRVYPLISKEL
jgi:hypothetical protein